MISLSTHAGRSLSDAFADLPDLSDKIVKSDEQYCGAGAFSDVYKRQYDSGTGLVEVAVKSFRFLFALGETENEKNGSKSAAVRKMIRRELGIWRRLEHPNIVPFLGVAYGFGRQGHASLVSLWMPNGSLQDFLGEHDDQLAITHRLQLLLDIADGLCYLHSYPTPIVHGDLSCNNVLLDHNFNARLTDFGYASMTGDIPEASLYLQMTTLKPGTVRWAAPEHFSADPNQMMQRTTKSDIYSFGNLGLLVLSGNHPWSEIQYEMAVMFQLSMGNKPKRPSFRPIEDPHWKLIERCWSSVDERPSAKDIVSSLQQFLPSVRPSPSLVHIFRALSHSSIASTPGLMESGQVPWTHIEGTTAVVLESSPQSLGQTELSSLTLSSHHKGKKRALTSDAEVDTENAHLRKRLASWPSHHPIYSVQIKSDKDPGIKYLSFSSDGKHLAVICNDRSLRIWNIPYQVETARLAQNTAIVAIAWMSDDMGVVSLGQDGVINKWTCTRQNQNHWQCAELLDGKGGSTCFAYRHDRIAVAFPRIGVKIWMQVKSTWQRQRPILRENVISIQFVEDGEALVGLTMDGVLWYCQMPNGTLHAYAFLRAKMYHLDINGLGTHALMSRAGGRAYLVDIQHGHKGKIERMFSMNEDSSGEQRQDFGAVFGIGSRMILCGSKEGNLLVWDRFKGEVICGLDHGESHEVQAVACFDRGSGGYIVTGTKHGVLSWWQPPSMES